MFFALFGLVCIAHAVLGAKPKAIASGPVDCGTCHRAESFHQLTTPMAHALELPSNASVLRTHPRLTFIRGRYIYTVTTQGMQSTYNVTDGIDTISLPILWGMGAGAQTWVVSRNGALYETLVSYFPSIDGLGVTIGDDLPLPHSLAEAVGREVGQKEISECLGCHATGTLASYRPDADGKVDLTGIEPGVTCEHCHTSANAHMTDAVKHIFNTPPPSLSALSAEELSDFCGQCHRTWTSVAEQRWNGPNTVRFAPYRLALSKCYDGVDARIRCAACHNPHENLSDKTASYDSKCMACHGTAKGLQATSTGRGNGRERQAKTCPVAKSDCVTCHMPKVPLADGHLTFTDHFIRIAKEGEPFPD